MVANAINSEDQNMKITTSSLDLSHELSARPRAADVTNWQNTSHFIVVTTDHKVFAFDAEGETRFAADLPNSMQEDKRLDIHCYENFVAVVESRGLNGIVFRVDQADWRLKLSREDYHCGVCTWAIGFYKRDEQVHLIHATQWNGLDITCLENSQCLTTREIDYEKELNYLDYFHSRLHMSPDQQHFVINGWIWSPWDVLYGWNIDEFLETFESGYVNLSAFERNGYNWDRPCCFVDNDTIAWGLNLREAGSDVAPDDQPTELMFQNIHSKEVVRRMLFEHFDLTEQKEVSGRLWFDSKNESFICSSNLRSHNRTLTAEQIAPTRGTTIVDSQGKEIWRSPDNAEFVSTDEQTIGFLVDNGIRLVRYPKN